MRGRVEEDGRLLAAALLAGAVAYAVHELYDWDWDIFGVTLPALLLLGSLVGSLAPGGASGAVPRGGSAAVGHAVRVRGEDRRRWRGRALGMATAVLCMASFVASVVIPRLAASRASAALVAASAAPAGGLSPALATALGASRLDPLSDAGLKAAATIAVHRGEPAQARRYLLAAVRRDPTDGLAWQQLAIVDLRAGADREGLAAAQRATALDPEGVGPITLARAAALEVAPPGASASATRTPASRGLTGVGGGAAHRGP